MRRAHRPLTIANSLIILRRDRKLLVSHPPAAGDPMTPATALTADELLEAMEDPMRAILFEDPSARAATERLVRSSGQRELVRAWGAVNSTGDPLSLGLLTDALSHAWHAPTETDVEDPDSWAEAFKLNTTRREVTLRLLATRAASSAASSAGCRYETSTLVNMEAKLASSARFSNLESECRLHGSIESLASAQKEYQVADPGLLRHHEVDGTVTRVGGPIRQEGAGVWLKTLSPFRLKVGRQVFITNGEVDVKSGRDGIIATRFTSGVLEIHVACPASALRWLKAEVAAGSTLHLREQPFGGVKKGERASHRWQKPKERPEAVQGREVPLDVILAGAPS